MSATTKAQVVYCGTRNDIHLTDNNQVTIGCKGPHPIVWWFENGPRLAKSAGYTENQVEEYMNVLKALAARIKVAGEIGTFANGIKYTTNPNTILVNGDVVLSFECEEDRQCFLRRGGVNMAQPIASVWFPANPGAIGNAVSNFDNYPIVLLLGVREPERPAGLPDWVMMKEYDYNGRKFVPSAYREPCYGDIIVCDSSNIGRRQNLAILWNFGATDARIILAPKKEV